MKLYTGTESGNSYKIRILLEQLGIAYEKVYVDLLEWEHKTPEFMARINPRGQVPVLEDDGRLIWDSAAIMVYIARKYDRQDWLPIDAAGMAEVMQWVAMAGTELQFGLQYARRGVARGRWIVEPLEKLQEIGRLGLGALEWRLKDHDWLALDRITIADIACFPYVRTAPEAKIPLDPYPGIRRWLARLESRPNWAEPPKPPTRQVFD